MQQNNNSMLDMVKDFHKAFEHPLKETILSDEPLKTRQLRIKLLFEELAELAEASDCKKTMNDLCIHYKNKTATTSFDNGIVTDGNNVDHVEELDALCDIQYVLLGKVLTGGYHKVFGAAFKVVHANNMTKAHTSAAHVTESIKHLGLNGTGYTIHDKGHGVILLYNEHGKLTKPFDHEKVSLAPLVYDNVTGLTPLYSQNSPTVEEVQKENTTVDCEILTVSELQKKITDLLSKNNCTLDVERGRTNQSYGKYANRLLYDSSKVVAITLASTTSDEVGVPLQVLTKYNY